MVPFVIQELLADPFSFQSRLSLRLTKVFFYCNDF